MNKTIITITAAALLAASTFAAHAAEMPVKPEHKAHYQRPYEPVGKTSFLGLPLGTVQPEGWIKDWAILSRDGLFGHADEYPPEACGQVFAKGWTGVDLLGSKGAGPFGSGWPMEQCATWLDGGLRLGLILHDDALVEKFMKRLLFIADKMEKTDNDFYTFMWWWSSDTKGPGDFDIKSNGWLGRAMAAAYEATRDPRILKAVEKAYRRSPYGHAGYGGGVNVNTPNMLDVWVLSGSASLWNVISAEFAKTSPGFASQRKAMEKKTGNLLGWSERHHGASTIIYSYGGLYAAPWMDNGADKTACDEMEFRTIGQYYMLPNGGMQGDEDMRGIGAHKGNESCTNARLMTDFALLWATGRGVYGDCAEKGFFNLFPDSVQRDFKGYTYFSWLNHNSSGGRLPSFVPLHGTLCCPGQMAKGFTSFLQNMWMATWDNGLAWVAYGPCSVRAKVGDGEGVVVNLKSTTAYPFEESIDLSVDPEKPRTFPLLFRVPEWCANFSIKVNGAAVDVKPDDKGFVTIRREWKAGDKVTLGLPMAPSVHVSRELEGAPFAAVQYGPLCMTLPVEKTDKMELDPAAEWKFALDAPAGAEKNWKIERSPMPAKWDWPLAAPLSIKVTAIRADWEPIVRKAHDVAEELKRRDNVVTHTQNDVTCLPAQPFPDGEVVELRFVPYGCARYHVTMFPITARTTPRIVVANPDPSLTAPLFVKESEIKKAGAEGAR